MNLRNYRLGELADTGHNGAASCKKILEVSSSGVICLASIRHLTKIMTRAKGLAAPFDDDSANVLVVG